jgi:hypothetical protein
MKNATNVGRARGALVASLSVVLRPIGSLYYSDSLLVLAAASVISSLAPFSVRPPRGRLLVYHGCPYDNERNGGSRIIHTHHRLAHNQRSSPLRKE